MKRRSSRRSPGHRRCFRSEIGRTYQKTSPYGTDRTATHPERQYLLHAEHPRAPAVLRDPDEPRVPDLDRVQRPVRGELHRQLEPLLVDRVRRRDLVHGRGDLDRHVLARELRARGALDVRELGADDRGREVARGVGRDGAGELAVSAVDEPAADQGRY